MKARGALAGVCLERSLALTRGGGMGQMRKFIEVMGRPIIVMGSYCSS